MISPSRPSLPIAAAFTLVEILLVLLIVSLLTAIAIPALSRSPRADRAGRAEAELVALLRQARMAAMGSAQEYRVRLTSAAAGDEAGVVSVDAVGDELPVAPARWPVVTSLPEVRLIDSAGDPFDADQRVVRFGPTGPLEAYVIELGGEAGPRIEITSPSGLIRQVAGGDDAAAGQRMAAMADYWETHCRTAIP